MLKPTSTVVVTARTARFARAALLGLFVSSAGVLVGAFVAGEAISRIPERRVRATIDVRLPPGSGASPVVTAPPAGCVCAPCELPAAEPEGDELAPEETGHQLPPRVFSCRAPFEGPPWVEPPEDEGQNVEEWPDDPPAVAVSGSAFGVVATWAGRHLALSRDDGNGFETIEGDGSRVVDVAVGARGTVFALRERSLQALPAIGPEATRSVPCDVAADVERDDDPVRSWIVADGGHLAVLCQKENGEGRILLSSDEGRSWERLPVPHEEFGVTYDMADDEMSMDVSISRAGRLTVVERRPYGEEGSYATLWQGLGRGGWREAWHVEGQGPGLGHDGTVYVVRWGCDYFDEDDEPMEEAGDGGLADRYGIAALSGRNRCRHVLEVPEYSPLYYAQFRVAENGRRTVALHGDRLLALGRTGAVELARGAPEGLTHVVLDPCDRVLAVLGGRVLRWREGRGWHVLYDWPARRPRPGSAPEEG